MRLDRRAGLIGATTSGQRIVVPGEPDRSLFVSAIKRQGDTVMPPDEKDKLSEPEIELLVAWIKAGAPWPKSAQAPAGPVGAADRAALDRQSHWAYQPVSRPAPPALPASTGSRGPLDQLLQAKRTAAGLQPSITADRRTLFRRLSYDLLGLPPGADDVAEFEADESPDAAERAVDRMLASPHYGERWGRHWLDLARYADTKGYAFAQERRYPYAYTYRDYVIGALNADVPYDRFILEQLAADRLPADGDARRLAALGFITTGRKFNNAHDDIDDKIDVVARGLLGLTVSCARCHDHKYDAIPMDDYYSLYGVFASCHEPAELPLIGESSQNAGYAKFEAELNKLKAEKDAFRSKTRDEAIAKARERSTDYLARVAIDGGDNLLEKIPFLSLGPNDLRRKLVDRWRDYVKKTAKPDHPVFGPWHDLVAVPAKDGEAFAMQAAPILERWKQVPEGTGAGQLNPLLKAALFAEPLQAKVELARVYGKAFGESLALWKQAGGDAGAEAKLPEPARQVVQTLIAKDGPTDFPLDDLGSYLNRAERNQLNELDKKIQAFQATSPAAPPRAMVVAENAQPHNPRIFIRGNSARPGKEVPRQFLTVVAGPDRKPFQNGSGRLELAQAIVAPENPLTRRVLVNRIWMWHFGESLVATPSDFGIRTEAPPQRDVLEYLAATLLERGWSLKALHRELITSQTYRQSSNDRPDCRAIDPENRLYWRMNRRRLEFETLRDTLLAASGQLDSSLFGRPVELTTMPVMRRRAVYGFVDRQDLPNLFRVFDFASPDQSADKRPRTTVPQQALYLMNSPLALEQARALARRPELAAIPETEVDSRIRELYRLTFARSPQNDELEIGRQFIALASDNASGDVKLKPWEQYAQLLLMTNETMFVD